MRRPGPVGAGDIGGLREWLFVHLFGSSPHFNKRMVNTHLHKDLMNSKDCSLRKPSQGHQ